jgi:hypothetical protein
MQFYQATSNGVIGQVHVKAMAAQDHSWAPLREG